ncbi:MAG TPA: thiazole synthase [Candidatus Dormibacteraeota bacterium]|nr:thiazole synthase [Candidatus Dormibacteraeota bacterium]
MTDDALRLGEVRLQSRLIHGTGKFPSPEVLAAAIAASGAVMITVAVRRLHLDGDERSELTGLDLSAFTVLPNTAGATTAKEAVRLARLARAAGLAEFIKIEVVGDAETLLPDPIATLEATRELVSDGFTVLPYASDDVGLALRLAEAGAAAVMPGAAPIGSTLGVLNPHNMRAIIERCPVPVIVDAGLGSPADAVRVMEWGAAGVLVNTGIARAGDPVAMAAAFARGVQVGRAAFLAGLAGDRREAGFGASSPLAGMPGAGARASV